MHFGYFLRRHHGQRFSYRVIVLLHNYHGAAALSTEFTSLGQAPRLVLSMYPAENYFLTVCFTQGGGVVLVCCLCCNFLNMFFLNAVTTQ